jgi:hypothetical protein
LAASVLAMLGLLAVIVAHPGKKPIPEADGQLESAEGASTPPESNAGSSLPEATQREPQQPIGPGSVSRLTPGPPANQVSTEAEPTPETRSLVATLVKIEAANGVVSPEQVATWRTNLQQLVQYGPAAVPAIREFLAQNTDLDFGKAGRDVLGYSSVRQALFDALGQIGGPNAVSVLAGTLQVVADPQEVGRVAQNLEKLEPGLHRQEALEAARQSLAMASQGKLPGSDVAPLFEVLQNYGDASVVPDLLHSAQQWGYYSMFALGQLPQSAGVPALIDVATGKEWPSGARDAAMAMIGQVAAQSPDARNALLDQIRQNKLTAYNWATLSGVLAGDQLHFEESAFDTSDGTIRSAGVNKVWISAGNQGFYAAPPAGGLSPEQINQQMELINELFEATTDANGQLALQRSKSRLISLLAANASATTPSP